MAWGEATRVEKPPFEVGYPARIALRDKYDNPHPMGSSGWEAWRRGWNYADNRIRLAARVRKTPGMGAHLTRHRISL